MTNNRNFGAADGKIFETLGNFKNSINWGKPDFEAWNHERIGKIALNILKSGKNYKNTPCLGLFLLYTFQKIPIFRELLRVIFSLFETLGNF